MVLVCGAAPDTSGLVFFLALIPNQSKPPNVMCSRKAYKISEKCTSKSFNLILGGLEIAREKIRKNLAKNIGG